MSDKKKLQDDEVKDEDLDSVSGGKLTIERPKDKYEQEADLAAEKVSGDPADKEISP